MTKFGYENFRGEITSTEINEFMEANGLGVTIYPDKALFITPDGNLISSKEDERQADGRTEDHRIVSDLIAEGKYMDTNPGLFWGAFHNKTRMIRYVPESNEALIEANQTVTTFQADTLEKLGSEIEKYVDYNQELTSFLQRHKSTHEITKEDLDRFVFEEKSSGNVEIVDWKPQGTGDVLVIPNQADLRKYGILKPGRNAYISKHILHNIALKFNDLPENGTPKTIIANSHSFSKLPIIDEDLSALFSEPKGFVGLDKIVKMDLTGLDMRNATSMERMFNGAESLRELNISSWNTRNVEDMSYMFANCPNLQTLKLDGLDVSNVKNMAQMFAGADTLRKLDLSKWQTHKVENMKGMFSMTSHLEKIKGIESWDTGNVKTMRNMFAGAGELTKYREKTIDLSGWDTSRVEDMSGMFTSSRLKINGLENWDTGKVKNMSYMFWDKQAANDEIPNLGGWKLNDTNTKDMFLKSNLTPALVNLPEVNKTVSNKRQKTLFLAKKSLER